MPSNAEKIEEAKSNLPLPEQPPAASDFNSADQSTVNVGSGGVSGETLRSPATGAVGSAGREGKDGLSGIPNDAVTRDQKDKAGLEQTTGKDYGYPEKNDPSEGVKQ
ncbi:hypothetical protein BDV95DRAFT_587507 [Massariosphaeria phaeospora]|uniref:Uncharacterized protein n=1 Tax=Massariosphaeria phaeospora TaxID=100035 RepID=A0A7C8M6I6_9PLEO|nr:hypothetical protein BDV95DRAFT_587507 [Massariosphaeria phaeospora]